MSKQHKTILLTFDYELFLGKDSGSIMNCMINPTKALIKVLDLHQAKAIFFVDCTYLVELKKIAARHSRAQKDYQLVIEQIVCLAKQGHFIYPHIHPHWLDAVYISKTNSWELTDLEKYSLANLTPEKKKSVFSNSVELLQNELMKAGVSVILDAYRAGGWSIQPFSSFKPLFIEHGIIADFSVLGGCIVVSDAQRFDFTRVKENQIPYYFENEVDVPDKDGSFVEFPIGSILFNKKSFANRLLLKLLWKSPLGQSMGKGIGVSPKVIEENIEYENRYQMLSVELLTHLNLGKYKRYVKENNFIQFVSHPKMMSRYNLKVLSNLLNHTNERYDCNYNWKHYSLNG